MLYDVDRLRFVVVLVCPSVSSMSLVEELSINSWTLAKASLKFEQAIPPSMHKQQEEDVVSSQYGKSLDLLKAAVNTR